MKFPITLEKKRGKYKILIEPEFSMNSKDEPDWFIAVKFLNKKDGKKVDECIILKKEVNRWIENFIREGYLEVKSDI